MVGSITNRYFASLAETVLEEAEACGYRMILELTRGNAEKSISSMEHLQRSRVDGIFYASGYFPGRASGAGKAAQRRSSDPSCSDPNPGGIASVGRDHSGFAAAGGR